MSWLSRRADPAQSHVEVSGYHFADTMETGHASYPDLSYGADDPRWTDGTTTAHTGISEWPAYVRTQHFKPEFANVTDVEATFDAGVGQSGYRERIDYEVGGETSAANAHPYWSRGPVTGKASKMTGHMAQIRRPVEGAYGDVVGSGPDYSQSLANAYYADSVANYLNDQMIAASVMAAI